MIDLLDEQIFNKYVNDNKGKHLETLCMGTTFLFVDYNRHIRLQFFLVQYAWRRTPLVWIHRGNIGVSWKLADELRETLACDDENYYTVRPPINVYQEMDQVVIQIL